MQSQTHRPRANTQKTKAHSVRLTESLWVGAARVAKQDDRTMNYVVTELMEGYARGLIKLPLLTQLPKTTAPRLPGHSVRCTDELWKSAERAAKQDGLTMNDVVTLILWGYQSGMMELPKVTKQFVATKKAG